MVGTILVAILFLLVVSALCSGDGGSTNAPPKRNTSSQRGTAGTRYGSSYSQCPSCGAPGYCGYCEECGYPDINQGWIGENY